MVGQTISFVFMTQEYRDYVREHVVGHHSTRHMTMDNPTVEFIVVTMGTQGGMPRRPLERRMLLTLVSPRYHLWSIHGRLASHLRGTSTGYRLAFGSWVVGQIVVATLTGTWPILAWAWLFPVFVLFNMATVLRLTCRHVFPRPEAKAEPDAHERIAGYSFGIFLGDRVPQGAGNPFLGAARWGVWWARLLLVHLPARLFVLVGDGPCHDFHHRHPRFADWPNYIHARQDDVGRGRESPTHWPAYTELWGLGTALGAVLESLSLAESRWTSGACC